MVRAAVVSGLVLAGCWKENRAFFVTDDGTTVDDPSATDALTTDVPLETTTTTTSTTGPDTTAGSDTEDETTTTTGSASGIDDTMTTTTSTSTSTTSDDTSDTDTTGGPDPVCGASGYGPVSLRARQFLGLIPQPCSDIPGRNFKVLGSDQGVVVAVACHSDPAFGCTGCATGQALRFGIEAPEPDGLLAIGSCVYLSAHGSLGADGLEECRYQQMALWANGTDVPAASPPLIILGHNTLGVDSTVAEVYGASPSIELVPTGEPCTCLDAADCCPDKAAEYDLLFSEAEEVVVPAGSHASISLGGATYEAYNGQALETGACAQEQQFDWWLLRH